MPRQAPVAVATPAPSVLRAAAASAALQATESPTTLVAATDASH